MARILLVEDDFKTREAMSDFLLMLGHEVLEAADGDEAVTVAKAQLPELILLDFSLPKQHGWAVARNLRADTRTQKIPIIAITAHVMVATQETAEEAGCDAYITKPVNLAAFEPWLKDFLAQHNLH